MENNAKLSGEPSPGDGGAAARTWTKEKPRVGGLYWYRIAGDGSRQSADFVEIHEAGPTWYPAHRSKWVAIPDGFEWAGPIPEPTGAPDATKGGA
jgi:hypothetical protein